MVGVSDTEEHGGVYERRERCAVSGRAVRAFPSSPWAALGGARGRSAWVGLKFGGWFLVIVSLFIAAGGFVGFFRMRRR